MAIRINKKYNFITMLIIIVLVLTTSIFETLDNFLISAQYHPSNIVERDGLNYDCFIPH